MKGLLTSFLLFFFTGLSAQNEKENLKSAMAKAPDTTKIRYLLKLSSLYEFDSALLYAEDALNIAKKIHSPENTGAAYKRIGEVFFEMSNYPPSLENFLNALKTFESLDNKKLMVPVLNNIGNVYARQEDYKTALEYYRAHSAMRKETGDDERVGYFGIGKAHEFLKNYDSALIYYQRAYEYLQATPSNPRTPFVLIHLGNVHLKKNNDLLAVTYARMAGSYVKYATDSSGISSIYTHIADIYMKTGSRDSAIYYADKAYQIALRTNQTDPKVEPALLLAELYASDPVRSYYYYKIGKSIQDSMFSRDRLMEIQRTRYNEMQRQRQLAEEKLKLETVRRNNIQYGAIGLGIALSCLFFLLLSRSFVVNERAVKFLGILILLMVFEFLNLVLHPYIGELTHHSPILMLLAMVVIAALLIPTHHHLEHWITKKMVQKNKSVRLQTARRIVEKLEKEQTNSSAY